MARRRKEKKAKLPKVAKYNLVSKETDEGKEAYAILTAQVKKNHEELRDARIVLAWANDWKSDRDGHVKLGAMKKASELERRLHGFDLVVVLNKPLWKILTEAQRDALLDHELCHADVSIDPTSNEPKEDPDGRKLYRLRRHDIEEFQAVVVRHGCYKQDLEQFAKEAVKALQNPLFPEGQKPAAERPRILPGGKSAPAPSPV